MDSTSHRVSIVTLCALLGLTGALTAHGWGAEGGKPPGGEECECETPQATWEGEGHLIGSFSFTDQTGFWYLCRNPFAYNEQIQVCVPWNEQGQTYYFRIFSVFDQDYCDDGAVIYNQGGIGKWSAYGSIPGAWSPQLGSEEGPPPQFWHFMLKFTVPPADVTGIRWVSAVGTISDTEVDPAPCDVHDISRSFTAEITLCDIDGPDYLPSDPRDENLSVTPLPNGNWVDRYEWCFSGFEGYISSHPEIFIITGPTFDNWAAFDDLAEDEQLDPWMWGTVTVTAIRDMDPATNPTGQVKQSHMIRVVDLIIDEPGESGGITEWYLGFPLDFHARIRPQVVHDEFRDQIQWDLPVYVSASQLTGEWLRDAQFWDHEVATWVTAGVTLDGIDLETTRLTDICDFFYNSSTEHNPDPVLANLITVDLGSYASDLIHGLTCSWTDDVVVNGQNVPLGRAFRQRWLSLDRANFEGTAHTLRNSEYGIPGPGQPAELVDPFSDPEYGGSLGPFDWHGRVPSPGIISEAEIVEKEDEVRGINADCHTAVCHAWGARSITAPLADSSQINPLLSAAAGRSTPFISNTYTRIQVMSGAVNLLAGHIMTYKTSPSMTSGPHSAISPIGGSTPDQDLWATNMGVVWGEKGGGDTQLQVST
jgi:hypothetical protein